MINLASIQMSKDEESKKIALGIMASKNNSFPMCHKTLLGAPVSTETEEEIRREDEAWEKALEICRETLIDYELGFITKEVLMTFVQDAVSVVKPNLKYKPSGIIGAFYREATKLSPTRKRDSSRNNPIWIIDCSLKMIKMARERDNYKIDKNNFSFISKIWKDLGLKISESTIESWYKKSSEWKKKIAKREQELRSNSN